MSEGLRLLWPFLITDAAERDNGWIAPYQADFVLSDLDRYRIECEVALEHAGDSTIAQAIDLVWETLGCPTLSTAAFTGYIEALSDIPGDLLWQAAKNIVKTYVYPTPPKPAHFHEQINGELAVRKLALRRITWMAEHKGYLEHLRQKYVV